MRSRVAEWRWECVNDDLLDGLLPEARNKRRLTPPTSTRCCTKHPGSPASSSGNTSSITPTSRRPTTRCRNITGHGGTGSVPATLTRTPHRPDHRDADGHLKQTAPRVRPGPPAAFAPARTEIAS